MDVDVGTDAGDQLLAVFQSELVVPFQVYVVWAYTDCIHVTIITATKNGLTMLCNKVNAAFIKGYD